MSFSADTTPVEDSDTASLYTASEESGEDLGAALSKVFGFRCQPEFVVKAKKSFSRSQISGWELPAVTTSLSYTLGRQSNYCTAVVKPTHAHNKWVRKVKICPESKEVKVVSQAWKLFGGAVKLQGTLGWVAGNKYPTLSYRVGSDFDHGPIKQKPKIPAPPSQLAVRPHLNFKYVVPQMSGHVAGGGVDNSVTMPYVHLGIPRVELLIEPGKPANWKAMGPTQWFGSSQGQAKKKLQWEQSLEHDSRKDLFVQSLTPEDREAYYKAHIYDR